MVIRFTPRAKRAELITLFTTRAKAEVINLFVFNEGEARVENMVLPCTSELCNYISYQVEMVCTQSTNSSLEVSLPLRGMLACQYSHNSFVMWRPRDTIYAQTMARHQSRV